MTPNESDIIFQAHCKITEAQALMAEAALLLQPIIARIGATGDVAQIDALLTKLPQGFAESDGATMLQKLRDDVAAIAVAASRPSLTLQQARHGLRVGYSGHYFSEGYGGRVSAAIKEKRGLITEVAHYDARGSRTTDPVEDGCTICEVKWDSDRIIGQSPGVNLVNLTHMPLDRDREERLKA